ncbi:hypothetical protein CCH79_00016954, partial [Gambusia affinis]
MNKTNGPCDEDLMYKILIKNKKLKSQIRREDKTEESADEGEDADADDEDEDEEDDEYSIQFRAMFWSPRKMGSKNKFNLVSLNGTDQKEKVALHKDLSDLVIYTRSVKFISFCHSRDNQNCYENTSMAEKKARKLMKSSGSSFIHHNQRFLSRIYPAGSRTSSSNYNPQEFWNVGAQLVALNFQSPGLSMDLNNGRFQDNGGCGYVLKPAVLMSRERNFDPNTSYRYLKPIQLVLKVISGSNLPVIKSRNTLDPFVRVEIHGIAFDSRTLTPHWDTDMNFSITVPELCLVRFCVRDQMTLFKSEFVGQYTLPFTSLKKGYRWVPLLSRQGCSLDPASLF